MTSYPHRSSFCRTFVFGVALALPLLALAQAKPKTSPDETPAKRSDQEDILVLSPFSVSTEKDDGYIAADTMSGGLLSTNLQKTATDVTVLTRKFLDDIGAGSMQEAQIWLTSSDVGIAPAQINNPTDFGVSVSFRGLPGTANTRNYWRNAFSPAEYTVERMEGSRGPNGIIFGDSLQGGKVNYLTKRASFRNFGKVRVRFESHASARATDEVTSGIDIDVNRKLNDKAAIRLALNRREGALWYEHSVNNSAGLLFAATYKPWRNAEVRLESSRDRVKTSNFRHDGFTDGVSNWDGFTITDGPIVGTAPNGTATGTARFGTAAPTWVYVGNTGLQNWQGYLITTGSSLAAMDSLQDGRENIARFPVTPYREFNIQSDREHIEAHNEANGLSFEQRFHNGLTFEAAVDLNQAVRTGDTLYFTGVQRDINRKLPDGRANPNFGKRYSLNNAGLQPIRTADYYEGARIGAAYQLPTKKFSQVFSVVGQYRWHLGGYQSWQYYRDNGLLAPSGQTSNATDANQIVKYWRYWDDHNVRDDPLPETTAPGTGFRWVQTRNMHTQEWLRSIQVNTVGKYFNDSVELIAGIRRDFYHATTRDIQRRDRVTGEPTEQYGSIPPVDSEVDTPQIGVTWFPIQQLGAYGYQSHGFNPAIIALPKLDGSTPYNLALSRGEGGGIRFNLRNGQIVGSFGYYHSFEKDKFSQQNLDIVNNIWRAVIAAGGPDKVIPQIGIFTQYTDRLTQTSWGWESEVTANLNKAWRVTLNVALPKTKQVDSLADTKAYVAANLSEWERYYRSAAVVNAVGALQSVVVNATDNRPINGLFDYRANVWANYTAQSGSLKGLRVGAGANFTGKQIIGNVTQIGLNNAIVRPADPFNFYYGDLYCLASASLGYSHKLFGQPVSWQLNVSNVFDYDEPIYRTTGGAANITQFNGVDYRNGFFWPTPRQIKLTMSVEF